MIETNTGDIQNVSVKALLYGPTGVGKTSTAKSLKPESTLIISAESGLLPLAGMKFTTWVMESWGDVEEAYKRLASGDYKDKFKVIFVDSLTEINEISKEQIVRVDRPGLGKDAGKVYADLLTQGDYQLLLTRMTRMVRAFRNLPFHVIFTCLEGQSKDERTGEIFITPSVNGRLALNIGGYFDEVFYMGTKQNGDKVDRYFLTGKVERIIAKDRSGALELYEQASWAVVFKKILKNIGGEK